MILTATLRSFLLASALGAAATSAVSAQQSFPTPEAASKALLDAAKAGDKSAVERIFGQGSAGLLSSGDPEEDKRRLDQFNEAAAEAVQLSSPNDATRVINVGGNPFAFPVPIVRRGQTWMFDVAAGRQEIL